MYATINRDNFNDDEVKILCCQIVSLYFQKGQGVLATLLYLVLLGKARWLFLLGLSWPFPSATANEVVLLDLP